MKICVSVSQNDEDHAFEEERKTYRHHDNGQDRLAYHLPQDEAFRKQAQYEANDHSAYQGQNKCRRYRHNGDESRVQAKADVAADHSKLAHGQD